MIELTTIVLALLLLGALGIGVRILPQEKWQFIATLPIRKNSDGSWRGLNLTYYGAITASSYVLAVAIFYFLAVSQHLSSRAIVFTIIILLSICMPAAKLIALVVEKKKHTFSVGGASFAGIVAAPWIVLSYNALAGRWHEASVPTLTMLAAISVAYAFGEGFGRLACLSFGCCYGKLLASAPHWLQKLCRHQGLIFTGKTKKVAYAHGLDGQPLVPVQVMTAYLYTAVGLIGFYLYLKGFTGAALMLTLATTQIWRILSEFLRADHRGCGMISAYQIMSLVSVFYVAGFICMLPPMPVFETDIIPALKKLWSTPFIISLQMLWFAAFIYSGRSQVTTSLVSLSVLEDRI